MQVANTNNKCFIVWSNEIEGRLDCDFYNPEFTKLDKKIKSISKKSLGDFVVSMSGGATPDIKESENYYTDSKDGIPFLRVQNLKPEGLELTDVKYINKATHEGELKRSQVEEFNLLTKITGVGRMAISSVAPKGFKGNINQHIVVIKTESEEISRTLAAFLNSNIGEKLAKRRSTGGTRPALDYEALKSIPVIFKPEIVKIMQSAYNKKAEKEQKAESFFNSIDDYILGELEIKMPEAEDKECFSINAQEVNNGRLDSYYYQPKFKEAEKSLKKANCKVEPLKNYITKIHYGASLKNDYVDEGIPLLRIQNLKPNRIILDDDVVMVSEERRKELGNAFLNEGDFLISRSGSVGIVSIVPKEAKGFSFGSFMIKFCLNDKISKDFVSLWLNNKLTQLFIKREKIGAIQGNITIETIENLQIPTPPLPIQEKLAKEVRERLAQAEKMRLEAKNEIEEAKQEVEKVILGK